MVINYYGEGCFRLQSGDLSLLVDSNNNRLKADVFLKTIIAPGTLPESVFEISFPGEYEVKGIEIFGWPVTQESTEKFIKTVYLVKWEGIKFAFFGHISEFPSPELLGGLDEPDILFVPIGGGHFLSADGAARLTKQLEPAMAIPSFYKDYKGFLKVLGQQGMVQEKLVFKRKDLEPEKMKAMVLQVAR